MSRDAFDRFTAKVPSWYYEIVAPGFKYNLTDIAAALGIHQLRRARAFQQQRSAIAAAYAEALRGLPLTLPPGPGRRPACLAPVRRAPGRRRADRPRRAHRAAVRGRHRLQRALHPAAPAAVLARSLRADAAAVSAQPARLRADAEPAALHPHDRCRRAARGDRRARAGWRSPPGPPPVFVCLGAGPPVSLGGPVCRRRWVLHGGSPPAGGLLPSPRGRRRGPGFSPTNFPAGREGGPGPGPPPPRGGPPPPPRAGGFLGPRNPHELSPPVVVLPRPDGPRRPPPGGPPFWAVFPGGGGAKGALGAPRHHRPGVDRVP